MKQVKALSCLALAGIATGAHAAAISFAPFIQGNDLQTTLGGKTPIGLAYAGDRFVGSANYSSGNQLYQADLNGGNVSKFAAPLVGFAGEIFVASSFASGPYGANQIYAGAENSGSVVQIAHDGSSQSVFTSGLVGGVRSIAFDPYGLYGNQMIVATQAGNVYTVSSSGVATLLASVGEDTEGLSFAPQQFGSFPKGTLFVASEGSGAVRAVNPDKSFSTAFTVHGAETVSFVPLNIGQSGNPVEGFYGVNYPVDVQKASADQFIPYAGHAIVTDETGHGIYDVSANGASFDVNNIGFFPLQPEDSIFVTAEALIDHGGDGVPDGGNTALLLLGGLAVCGCILPRKLQSA